MTFKIPSGSAKVQFSIRVDENDFNIIEKLSKKKEKATINEMIIVAL